MKSYLEAIAFAFLCALIRTQLTSSQIAMVLLCVLAYIVVFREYNNENPKKVII